MLRGENFVCSHDKEWHHDTGRSLSAEVAKTKIVEPFMLLLASMKNNAKGSQKEYATSWQSS